MYFKLCKYFVHNYVCYDHNQHKYNKNSNNSEIYGLFLTNIIIFA